MSDRRDPYIERKLREEERELRRKRDFLEAAERSLASRRRDYERWVAGELKREPRSVRIARTRA